MTIHVEREALLRVLSREPSVPSSSPCEPTITDNGEFVLVDIPKPFMGDDCFRRSQVESTCDDDRSLCTLSTDSLSTDSSVSVERRVTFATPLVTEEWSRPWTPRSAISMLYYSTEETQRFRQEYRLERKVLNDLSVDPENLNVDNEELSNIIANSSSCPNRHRISRVVVLHNDKLETFFSPDEVPSEPKAQPPVDFFDNDSFWSGSLTWY